MIVEWFERHRDDYCHHDQQAPPKVWSEHFAWLLNREIQRQRSEKANDAFLYTDRR